MKFLSPALGAQLIKESGGKTLVITGAGVSTESSIPDYRGASGRYKLGNGKPMTHQEYMGARANRQRFWARSLFGFNSFDSAQPNRTHIALHALQRAGYLHGLITQNVDRLHSKVDDNKTFSVLELHGRGDVLECQACQAIVPRNAYQHALKMANLEWYKSVNERQVQRTADGDAFLPSSVDTSQFKLLPCSQCNDNGVLKPAYVFFGGSVPQHVVERANALVREAELVFLIGSTAHTFSCFRLLRDATQKYNKRLLIVNQGETRADALAYAKYDQDSCGAFWEQVTQELKL